MRIPPLLTLLAALAGPPLWAQTSTVTVTPQPVTEWKAVYGQVESRDRVPARARIGGTLVSLAVTEGDRVTAGQRIAVVEDDKLQFQIDSVDAQLDALRAQLETAQTDLTRGETLRERGVITQQRLDQLQTAVDVIEGQMRGLDAQRLVVEQQISEGEILSPQEGIVLSVPVSRGSVLTPGEAAAVIGGGGTYLRLSVPERHAEDLTEGDVIEIGTGSETEQTGTLVKLYPQIEGGRVQADVEVEGLDARFVGRRVPVRLPVGEREAMLVPDAALFRHGGLDYVTVSEGAETRTLTVVPGGTVMKDGAAWREILTGLRGGEEVVLNDE
ncbi:efflux RND transporter periplasmic adaptor subunit [Sagittula salina]|uniref:Efflux RND transporter periplasmic adaptor subunit n=1 Tax=Sagittula salina TaxID=2820268 RepID=A0A940S1J4_9RHOB|nr:efflux RND transporter periplasmic adaptor subunit [Sagittula salina]MBP0484218.1 efflux RND transporter periplasmic adaptor subunit [Sagittula salina]